MAILTGSCSPQISFGYALSNPFVSANPQAIQLPLSLVFGVSGPLANQCDTIYAQVLSLAGTPQSIDLKSFVDVLGVASSSLSLVRFLAWRNRSLIDAQVVGLGGGSTPWPGLSTGVVNAYPSAPVGGTSNDGFTLWSAPNTTGMPVATGASLLKVDPGASSMLFDLIIAGCH